MANTQRDPLTVLVLATSNLCLEKCQHLKNVFSLSIARGLVQLQKLEIDDCDDMEGCFHKEGEDDKALNDNIMFPQLMSIELDSLPRLIGFCTGVGPVELVQPSLNREVQLNNSKARCFMFTNFLTLRSGLDLMLIN